MSAAISDAAVRSASCSWHAHARPLLRDAPLLDPSAPLITAIVDDDASIRRALQRVVEAGGYTAKTFASAREFLDALPRYRVACLVLDIYLGGMNGFDLLERLGADGVRIPVILITARDDAPTRERIARSAVAGHLFKPFEGPALLDAIGGAIGGEATRMIGGDDGRAPPGGAG